MRVSLSPACVESAPHPRPAPRRSASASSVKAAPARCGRGRKLAWGGAGRFGAGLGQAGASGFEGLEGWLAVAYAAGLVWLSAGSPGAPDEGTAEGASDGARLCRGPRGRVSLRSAAPVRQGTVTPPPPSLAAVLHVILGLAFLLFVGHNSLLYAWQSGTPAHPPLSNPGD